MIPPKQSEELLLLHQHFLQTPIANQLKRILDSHIELLVTKIAAQSMQLSNVTDQEFRQLAVQLNTVKTIKTLIYDSTAFVTKASA